MSHAFFDTNILIYSVVCDDPRWTTADRLLEDGGHISVQSLNEFVNVLRRKLRFEWSDVRTAKEAVLAVCEPPLPLTQAVHERGVFLAERHNFTLYDAMIVAAALIAGCDTLYTEDLHDGLVVDGTLTIRNPFVQAAG